MTDSRRTETGLGRVRIPYDSINLAAVVAEAQTLVGSRLDRINQTDPLTLVLGFYSGVEQSLLLSSEPNYSRAYLLSRRPPGLKPIPPFGEELRKHLVEAQVVFVRQRGLDRVLEIGFKGPEGTFILVAELMGRHSNMMLVSKNGFLLAAAKWVGATKSIRPILPGKPYVPPPFEPKPSLLEATDTMKLTDYEGASPFLVKLLASGFSLSDVQSCLRTGQFHPTYSPGYGAYPFSVQTLGFEEIQRSSISQALEQHFEALVETDRFVQTKYSLKSQLERLVVARESALSAVKTATETARDARAIQIMGELILAYQGSIQPKATKLEAWDYDGQPISVTLKEDLSPVANANQYFLKAKKAKSGAEQLGVQLSRLEADLQAVHQVLARLELAETSATIEDLRELADSKKWLQRTGEAKAKEDRPFEGHAVRELLSPGGWRVLYGDNATANDYLTTKLAKPADLWFHVRGGPSAHVVLCTNNQPLKVQRADLEFAAIVAVRHSSSKHSGFVSVDYTQKRHVRKPRGSNPGMASYTQEKTLHVIDS